MFWLLKLNRAADWENKYIKRDDRRTNSKTGKKEKTEEEVVVFKGN